MNGKRGLMGMRTKNALQYKKEGLTLKEPHHSNLAMDA